MDSSAEGAEADGEMMVLTAADGEGEGFVIGDEEEHLQNSLREAVRDDSVRPKMQCLMMDSSFSMVTVQGEDSGIAWETTPSRCGTPWASDGGGGPAADSGPQAPLRSSTPAGASAGRIIFVMDEEVMSKRKRSRESEQKRRQDRQREGGVQTSGEFWERPELVEVSLPNVKSEEEDEEDVPNDPPADRLFSLVSEGSEILNIIVPTKLATVDEEESREMVDNLSYLDESPLPKAGEDTQEPQQVAPAGPTPAPVRAMDPPGAPVARPPRRRASGAVDYFEAYNLIDAQAPGGPAVIAPEGEPNPEVAAVTRGSETTPLVPAPGITSDLDKSDTVSLEEFTSELLDDVFYGGTEEKPEGGPVAKDAPSKGPSKPSGSILFGGEEDVLTPIFLPDGPPKIIDPILLEEPKAMAFLYTDLYEEATGCRTKDEDVESVGSEKSFHSRYSDREARGYLEKYALIDETPVVEMEAEDNGRRPEEGLRVLSQDLYDYSSLTKPEKEILPDPEEEITDFFRSSASSSPCELLPFHRSLKAEEAETTAETKEKTQKVVSLQAKPDFEEPVDAPDTANSECPYEELDWGITDDHLAVLDIRPDHGHQEVWRDSRAPVAPPRKKASSPKTRLDLCPLTPVDVQEKVEASGKEKGDGEKETEPAPHAKTGKGDGEESPQPSPPESLEAAAEPPQRESTRDDNELPLRSTASQETEGSEAEAEAATEHVERVGPGDHGSSEADNANGSQKAKEVGQMPTESAKEKGRCVIL